MKYGKVLFGIFAVLALFGVAFAATATPSTITNTLGCTAKVVQNALAVGMLLLVVLAAITYAVGQMLGAETRARASVWATAMFTGAIIGALLYILLPFILRTLLPDLSASLDLATLSCV